MLSNSDRTVDRATICSFDLLGVQVSVVNLSVAIDLLEQRVKQRRRGYVCASPVSSIVEAHRNAAYKMVLNKAYMVVPDGMPVAWVGKCQGFTEIGRTYGPDLMLGLCGKGLETGMRHFFYGGTTKSNEMLVNRLRFMFPDIVIAGIYSPSAISEDYLESVDIIREINDTKPDVIWVGLGSPKQDFWMSNHRSQLSAPLMVGVGAAFDFLSGQKLQAPLWMRNNGLEWLFRFLCEPRRLWRRYLLGNSYFVYLLLRQILLSR
ncbi:MAG: WecB/TagA/CpsF family glycosyltransferase [Gammaproteobacteria bacterium]|nr:WecB/TagA/CpsF family glycosyltransferase [Gammaproteobacteria bacterium]